MKNNARHISIKPISHWYLVVLLGILVLLLVLSLPTAVASRDNNEGKVYSVDAVQLAPKPIDLSAYKGKVVIAEFWGSWCYQCANSMSWLNQMFNKYEKEGLIVLGVNLDSEHKKALLFEKKHPSNFPIMYDAYWQYADFYKVKQVPTLVIFNRNGEVIHKHTGFKVTILKPLEQLINVALQ